MPPRSPRLFAVLTAASLSLTAACGADDPSSGSGESADVVVGFYPLQFVAERVAGDHMTVTSLAQPGAEPHDMELSPQQIAAVAEARLVVHEHGFQPALDEAVEQNAADHSLDVATAVDLIPVPDAAEDGHEHGDGHPGDEHAEDAHTDGDDVLDPHFWLDPTRLAEVATAVADELGQVDPDHAEDYTANATALTEELSALDQEFTSGLATCERTEFVTTHTAFGYLAERYDLTQIGIAGLSPEEEPSSARLDEVRVFAEEHGVTTIFYEEAVSPDYAETIAAEVGAETAVLSPIEVAPEDGDYIDGMTTNLQTLRAALGCA